MKKNLSYREKLLELSKIYKISEIQNYIRSKKHLTTSQIEHILKKNKVPIPTEINVSFLIKLFQNQFLKLVRVFLIFMVIQLTTLQNFH